MGKRLIIAEKPSLAKSIVAGIGIMKKEDGYYENDTYIVTYAFGHLFELKNIDDYLGEKKQWSLEDLPYIPKQFEFKLKDDPGVKKQYKTINELYKRKEVESLINAGDPDREGSVIIMNLVKELERDTGLKKRMLRIWLTATTPEFVQEALRTLKEESYYGNLYEEGLARTYMDWIYGLNLTRFVTIKAGGLLPVGRVLMPIIRYVYERDKQISEFNPEKYFEIEALVDQQGEKIKGKIKQLRFIANEKQVAAQKLMQLQEQKAIVKEIKTKEIHKQPPKLFSLDQLQNKMNQTNNFSPAETLALVQKLYESGYVSYPRTNTEYLSTAEKGIVEGLLEKIRRSEQIQVSLKETKRIFDDSKIEGHTALIITSKEPNIQALEENEVAVYQTIKNRFISNFLDEETIMSETRVTIEIGDEVIELTGNSILQQGFLKYERSPKEKFLPNFQKGEELNITLELAEKSTEPPSRVTEIELNEFLKNPFKKNELNDPSDDEDYKAIMSGCEIGTVATRAGIIENAFKYEYIKQEKKSLFVTKKGVQLIKILVSLQIDLKKDKTVQMGMELKQIFQNKKNIDEVVQATANEVIHIISSQKDICIEAISSSIGKCPLCDGTVLSGQKSFYCSKYKENDCKFTLWKEIAGKKITEKIVEQLITKKKTAKIKGFKSKAGNTFEAALAVQKDGSVKFIFSQ